MRKYDAVVIGAGNGGLAAACRMAKGGKKTLLIERHNLPGGCASSFRRGRFEFETALHEICEWGTKENPGGCRKRGIRAGYSVAYGAGQLPRHNDRLRRQDAYRRDLALHGQGVRR